MKKSLFCLSSHSRHRCPVAGGLLLGLALAATTRAQGYLPAGTVSGSGSGPYNYSLSFSDQSGATSPIGSVWYAWVPGSFFLPATPTSASAPAGWTANISSQSIQFVASSSAFDIQPGQTLSGFDYDATFSPSTLANTPNSGESVAYSGALFSDSGGTFTVQAVPEPSVWALVAFGAFGLPLLRRWRTKAA